VRWVERGGTSTPVRHSTNGREGAGFIAERGEGQVCTGRREGWGEGGRSPPILGRIRAAAACGAGGGTAARGWGLLVRVRDSRP